MRVRWPVIIGDHEITLRPLRMRDRFTWEKVRRANHEWLGPWEATRPMLIAENQWNQKERLPTYYQMVRHYRREGRSGRQMAFAIWLNQSDREVFIGQITLGGIVMGAYRGAHIGYWIDQRYANLGYTTRAVQAVTHFAFTDLHLHRIEINLRPENHASKKVAEKAGYYFEGIRPRYLHIDGDWRDHLTFVAENPKNFN
jgi:ribosomal-protein-alanine N-acetyltransferase